MIGLLKKAKIEEDTMTYDGPYCSLAGIYFVGAAFKCRSVLNKA
jgi:hypothetical protein